MYHESNPGQAGYRTLTRLHGKIWPRLREPGLADPTYHCKLRDQIKMRDYMDRRVTPMSGLPHLPGVPFKGSPTST